MTDGIEEGLRGMRPARGARGASADLGTELMRHSLRNRLFDEDTLPLRLRRYLVLERLGKGGTGVVYAAYDPTLERKVAIKLLGPQPSPSGDDSSIALSLVREAQALAQLTHPNVVTVHEVGDWEGRTFMAMELVEGDTLAAWMRDGTARSVSQVAAVFLNAARGLQAAHDAGIVHGDFKPHNVAVGEDGRVCVFDFGIAERSGRADEEGAMGSSTVAGTPAYMAPEQHAGLKPTPASDVYSFAVSLFEAMTAERPFTGKSMDELARAKEAGPPTASSGTRLPKPLRRLVNRALLADPIRRPSLAELIAGLERASGHRTWSTAAVALVAVAAIGGTTLLTSAEVPCGHSPERMEGVWTPQKASDMQRRFAQSDLAYAVAVAHSVTAALDSWSATWVESREDACRATHVRAEQSSELLDRRMLCYDRQLAQARATIGVLADADPAVIEHGLQIAARLPRASRCSDPDSVPGAGIDPVVAEELQGKLGALIAWAKVGDRDHADPLVEELLALARDAEVPSYEAAALLRKGALEAMAGKYEASSRTLHDAIDAAERSDHAEVKAAAWTWLVFAVGLRLGRHDDAQRYAAHAQAVLDRSGPWPGAEARLRTNLGLLALERGAVDVAGPHLEAAVEVIQRSEGVEIVVASYRQNLAWLRLEEGQTKLAIELFEQSAKTLRELAGEQYPPLAQVYSNLGVAYKRAGDLNRALETQNKALGVAQSVRGKEHPMLGQILGNLASMAMSEGRTQEALDLYQRALASKERAFPPEHPTLTYALDGVGAALLALGRRAEAARNLRRAVSILEKHGHAPGRLAGPRFRLAQALEDSDIQQAMSVATQARDDAKAVTGSEGEQLTAEIDRWLAERASPEL